MRESSTGSREGLPCLDAARAGMARLGNDGAWRYEHGFLALAAWRCAAAMGDGDLAARALDYVSALVGPDGAIAGYREDEYNLDQVNPGKLLFHALDASSDRRFAAAAEAVAGQLLRQPRTPSGGYWHKKIYPDQIWLDGLYMAEPFAARFAAFRGNPEALEGVARQFELAERATREADTGLLRHAWDESRRMPWSDARDGRSPCVWGRAMGWFALALVDTLDWVPAAHPVRPRLLAILERLGDAVLAHAEAASGLWYQLIDRPALPGNYLETSASAMFAAALLKALRRGYAPAEKAKRWSQAGEKAARSLIRDKAERDGTGGISVKDCCLVAGLGGNPYRDGSPAYYLGEPRVRDDAKGVAAFVLATLELAALQAPDAASRLSAFEGSAP